MHAPRFYVSVKEAFLKYSLYRRGKLDVTIKSKVDMYKEIFRRFEQAYNEHSKYTFAYSIMQEVLNSEAPSFYMEESTAVDFYYRAMRNRRKKSRK